MKAMTINLLLSLSILALFVVNAVANEDFPLRAKYPSAKHISTAELATKFANVIVVDVRSTEEFDVAHINKARHVPISKASFERDLEGVRNKTGNQLMAFYCNGHTCAKSYKAYIKAFDAGFINIVVYDAGIFDWIMSNPEKATLMGKTPAPKDKIIPKSKLQEHMVNFGDLKGMTSDINAMAIDIRDPFQRNIVPDIAKLRNIPMDRMIPLLRKNKFQDKKLLIIDAVGKQVRWLQYHLEENGYTDYKFLEKGVAGIK